MSKIVGSKTLATRLAEALASGSQRIPVQAHANLVTGNIVEIAVATGITSAPSDLDRIGLFGVIVHPIAVGTEGYAVIKGPVRVLSGAAITAGVLIQPNNNMRATALATQTDGNGFARAYGAAAGADTLVWANIL